MIIISHRGYWKAPSEKNRTISFKRSFDYGFGTETDVRDYNGQLVISHDIPNGSELTLEEFLAIFSDSELPLALNIKADGLVFLLKDVLIAHRIKDWFLFDMSIPDMRSYLQAGVPVFARMSEVERTPAWMDEVAGIWLDAFSGIWYTADFVEELLQTGKRVCIVSPELHGQDPVPLWNMLKPISQHPSLIICTDQPESARNFFGGLQ